MPTYDYECLKGHRFELFQKMSDEPVTTCPDCGAEARRRISGGAGFLFKGDGFYITDYRSEEYRKKASADGGDTASAKGESESSATGSGSTKTEGASAKSEKSASKGDSGGSKASSSGAADS